MAAAPSRSLTPSLLEDNFHSSSSLDLLSDDAAAAAAQEALGASPSGSDSPQDEIPLDEVGPEAQSSPPQDSSPPQEQSQATDSSAVLLFLERMGNVAELVGNHCKKYRWAYLFFVLFLIVVLVTSLIPLIYYRLHQREQPYRGGDQRPSQPPPVRPDPLEPWHPWHERPGDLQFPRILLWNRPSVGKHQIDWYILCPAEHYRHALCDVTVARQMLASSDAIVLDDEHLVEQGLPTVRQQFQYWVFWSKRHVSPDHDLSLEEESSLRLLKDKINWTMAWREDADIVLPYRTWRCGFTGNRSVSRTAVQHKATRKEIAWIVSTCEEDRFEHRAQFFNETHTGMAHTVSVKLFTSCGSEQCTRPRDCIPYIAKNYQFIVVTLQPDCFQSAYEVIYDAFNYNLVPVVLAPLNTTLNVPAHSVVSWSDLQETGKLSEHLRRLLSDSALYESYFTWKNNCSFVNVEDDLCPLCRAVMTTPALYRTSYDNIRQWWTRAMNCTNDSFYGLDEGFNAER